MPFIGANGGTPALNVAQEDKQSTRKEKNKIHILFFIKLNKRNQKMEPFPLRLILADDDNDDCLIFNEALNIIAPDVELSIVKDGGAIDAATLQN